MHNTPCTIHVEPGNFPAKSGSAGIMNIYYDTLYRRHLNLFHFLRTLHHHPCRPTGAERRCPPLVVVTLSNHRTRPLISAQKTTGIAESHTGAVEFRISNRLTNCKLQCKLHSIWTVKTALRSVLTVQIKMKVRGYKCTKAYVGTPTIPLQNKYDIKDPSGYSIRQHAPHPYVTVTIDGRMEYLHRLVAEQWLEHPEGCDCVDHKNGDRTDNRNRIHHRPARRLTTNHRVHIES
jgi:hypothetical protein